MPKICSSARSVHPISVSPVRALGRLVFSLRDDAEQDPAYPAALERLTIAGRWRPVFTTASFRSMPYGEPEITRRVHVYERTEN